MKYNKKLHLMACIALLFLSACGKDIALDNLEYPIAMSEFNKIPLLLQAKNQGEEIILLTAAKEILKRSMENMTDKKYKKLIEDIKSVLVIVPANLKTNLVDLGDHENYGTCPQVSLNMINESLRDSTFRAIEEKYGETYFELRKVVGKLQLLKVLGTYLRGAEWSREYFRSHSSSIARKLPKHLVFFFKDRSGNTISSQQLLPVKDEGEEDFYEKLYAVLLDNMEILSEWERFGWLLDSSNSTVSGQFSNVVESYINDPSRCDAY